MKKSVLLASLLLAATAVSAQATEHKHLSAEHFTENNVTVGYADYDLDGLSLDGYTISAGKQYDNAVYLRTNYTVVSADVMGVDLEVKDLAFVVGKQFEIDANSLVYVDGGVHFLKATAGRFGGDSETEVAVAAGYKRALTHSIGMTAGLGYMDTELSLDLGVQFSITEKFALNATYSKGDELDTYTIGAKYYF